MSYRIASLESLLALALAACVGTSDARTADGGRSARPSASSEEIAAAPTTNRDYGAPTKIGDGTARTYVNYDAAGAPTEVGVLLEEGALEGLPGPMKMAMPASNDGHEHVDSHVFDLNMPAKNPTPYKFLELDWNPAGHEPPGVYDHAHFDFHFYTVEQSVRDGIDPARMSKEEFVARSSKLPPRAEWAPSFVAIAAPGAPVMAVPRMGAHWVDLRTPELQAVFGHPEGFKPFTTTFLHGSWDGQFIFDEPMITRAFILGRKAATTAAQRDTVIALDAPASYRAPGYYPGAYRVTYDAEAKAYRIALTQLARKP